MEISTINKIAQELKIDGFDTAKSVNEAAADFEECAHVAKTRKQAIAWLAINFFHDGEEFLDEAILRSRYQVSDSDIQWAEALYA